MLEGIAGKAVGEIAMQLPALLPQLLIACTQIFPPVNEEKFTVMEFEVDEPEAPEGNVHT
jgi:hypothetical protein